MTISVIAKTHTHTRKHGNDYYYLYHSNELNTFWLRFCYRVDLTLVIPLQLLCPFKFMICAKVILFLLLCSSQNAYYSYVRVHELPCHIHLQPLTAKPTHKNNRNHVYSYHIITIIFTISPSIWRCFLSSSSKKSKWTASIWYDTWRQSTARPPKENPNGFLFTSLSEMKRLITR